MSSALIFLWGSSRNTVIAWSYGSEKVNSQLLGLSPTVKFAINFHAHGNHGNSKRLHLFPFGPGRLFSSVALAQAQLSETLSSRGFGPFISIALLFIQRALLHALVNALVNALVPWRRPLGPKS